jgi:hypothetical protein
LAIWHRKRTLVNTDPQRCCYNGAHFSSEPQWTAWAVLERMDSLKPCTTPEDRLKFWRDINDYAIRERGEHARTEFKLESAP